MRKNTSKRGKWKLSIINFIFPKFIYSGKIKVRHAEHALYIWTLQTSCDQLWHYVGGPLSRRSLCLSWHETKQRPEPAIFNAIGSGQGNARERERGVGQRNPEKSVGDGLGRRAVGSRHRTAEETSRHEIESSITEGRPVKISPHSSWFVEFSQEIHASISLHRMQCHNLTFLHLSWPKPYCSFVLCSFSPTPLIVFLVP